jgi:hypothetical protein
MAVSLFKLANSLLLKRESTARHEILTTNISIRYDLEQQIAKDLFTSGTCRGAWLFV